MVEWVPQNDCSVSMSLERIPVASGLSGMLSKISKSFQITATLLRFGACRFCVLPCESSIFVSSSSSALPCVSPAVVYSLSYVWLFVTPWTVVHQDPLSMGFAKQETGVGSHFLLKGIFQIKGLNPHLHVFWISGRFFTAESPGKHIQALLAIKADVLGAHLPGTYSLGWGVLLGAQTPPSLWRTFAVVIILYFQITDLELCILAT